MRFQQPSAGGDAFKPAEHIGRLVLIWAKDYRENIATSFGAADAICADVHVIDSPNGPEVFKNALLFQRALIASLRDAIGGDPVLGRIGQGTAKPGQSAPYILTPFTDADAQAATAYVESLPKPFQAPAAQQQAAAPGPIAQMPQQAAARADALYQAAQQQLQQQAPAAPAPAAPAIDPGNLPPDVAALLAQLQGRQG